MASNSLIFALAVAILNMSCLEEVEFSELFDCIVEGGLLTVEADVKRCHVK